MTTLPQQYATVAVADLTEHPANPRVGDVAAIVAAITANGWHGALLVQRSTGHVLAGNHRLRAARQLGMAEVPVLWVDVDDHVAERILVADNRASDFGYFDEDQLVALLAGQQPDDLAAMLYTEADLAMLAPGDLLSVETDAAGGVGVDGAAADPAVQLNTPGTADTEGYLATQARSVVLPYPLDDYVRVTDQLRQLRQARSVPTNAELVAALVADAVAAL